MKPFTVREAIRATGGQWHGTDEQRNGTILRVVTDSRSVRPGDMFVAFSGARADGHSFMADCLKKGAVCCISERMPTEEERPCIQVPGSLQAIGALAGWYRSQFTIPVIGVTGSVGKTTTKEMLASVLSEAFRVHKTEKNHNNELGVPWTLLALEEEHQAAVVEMGISGFGEMRRLTGMVRPDIAVITTIGDAHLEFLGDRNGVLRAKTEIFEGMRPDGTAILNGDDPLLRSYAAPVRTVTYGLSPELDFYATDVDCRADGRTRCRICHHGRCFEAEMDAFGLPAVYAALAACAAGWTLGMDDASLREGLKRYQTVGDRARVIKAKGCTIISDCYNANPNSVKAALRSLSMLEGRKVAVLGDMKELGLRSPLLHREVGARAAEVCDLVLACGPLAEDILRGAEDAGGKAEWFRERDELIAALPRLIRRGDNVLVKASRAMQLEAVTEALGDL